MNDWIKTAGSSKGMTMEEMLSHKADLEKEGRMMHASSRGGNIVPEGNSDIQGKSMMMNRFNGYNMHKVSNNGVHEASNTEAYNKVDYSDKPSNSGIRFF